MTAKDRSRIVGYKYTMTTSPVHNDNNIKWHAALTTWGQIAAVIITLITVIGSNIISVQVHLSKIDDKIDNNKALQDVRISGMEQKLNAFDGSLTSLDNRLRELTSAQQKEDGKLDSLILLSKRNSSN
jgi:peptidoglycan hydrolase CwlO-like protein